MCEATWMTPEALYHGLRLAIASTRVVPEDPTATRTVVSAHAPGRDSGCATRSNEGFSNFLGCEPGLRDSMSEVSVGVYEGMYRSMR